VAPFLHLLNAHGLGVLWRPDRMKRASHLRQLSVPLLLLLPCLISCGGEDPPRLSDAGPRPAQIDRRDARSAKAGGVLAATGHQSFQGPTAFRCVLHDEDGLQINFRTGDPDTPVVSVRIADYQGSGPYRADLFVTGRSRTGALVTSKGPADVEVQQRELPDAGTVVLLNGSFTGSYAGQAGRGSVEGRFGPCGYSPYRNGSPDSLIAKPLLDEGTGRAGGEAPGQTEGEEGDEAGGFSPSSSPPRH
jgi:hypothetical protein